MEEFLDLSKINRTKKKITKEVLCLEHQDWMAEYEKDLASGNVIIMDSNDMISENELKANDRSIFDPRFKIPIDVEANGLEYSCDCKNLLGRFNEGVTCPECNSIVEIRYSADILKRGWIDLENYYIINPSIYGKLSSYLTERVLVEIISYKVRYDRNGIVREIDESPNKKNPFIGIGIMAFKERYVEILDFFKTRTRKPKIYDVLMDRKDITFTNKIMVMSSAHRPGFASGSTKKNYSIKYHDVNSLFIKILTDSNLIKSGNKTGGKAIELLYKIQVYMMEIVEKIIEGKLKGKGKLLRTTIISGRLWYTARMIIISEVDNPNIDCTTISYAGFLGLFELEIISAMMKGIGCKDFVGYTITQCIMYLKKCKYDLDHIDEKIYSIMDTLINDRKDDGLYVVINRNPSFDIGSIQTFRIYRISKDPSDFTISIPHNSLGEFNGDHDGDCLNVHSPKEKCVVEAFKEGFLPSKLILDRSGGFFNYNMSPIKDELAFIRMFCDDSYSPINPKDVTLDDNEKIASVINNKFSNMSMEEISESIKELVPAYSECDISHDSFNPWESCGFEEIEG